MNKDRYETSAKLALWSTCAVIVIVVIIAITN